MLLQYPGGVDPQIRHIHTASRISVATKNSVFFLLANPFFREVRELADRLSQVKPLGVGETLGCTSPHAGDVDAAGAPRAPRLRREEFFRSSTRKKDRRNTKKKKEKNKTVEWLQERSTPNAEELGLVAYPVDRTSSMARLVDVKSTEPLGTPRIGCEPFQMVVAWLPKKTHALDETQPRSTFVFESVGTAQQRFSS